jgi:hypothetical protein
MHYVFFLERQLFSFLSVFSLFVCCNKWLDPNKFPLEEMYCIVLWMSGGVKLMKMLDFLKRRLKSGLIGEFLRENSMLVRKFYCIGLVSNFLQENYSRNGKDPLLSKNRSGAVKIALLKDNTTQVVNGQRLKHYISGDSYNEDIDIIQVVTPEEFIKEQV